MSKTYYEALLVLQKIATEVSQPRLFSLSPEETRVFNCNLVEKSPKGCLFQVYIFKIIDVLKKISKPNSSKWITSEKCPLHTLDT